MAKIISDVLGISCYPYPFPFGMKNYHVLESLSLCDKPPPNAKHCTVAGI